MHGLANRERLRHVLTVCQLALATHTISILGERFTRAYIHGPLFTFYVDKQAGWSKKRMVQEARREICRRASDMVGPAEAMAVQEVHYESRFILSSAA